MLWSVLLSLCFNQSLTEITLRYMGKILGLDVGAARVGVSLSDEALMTARPLVTLARAKGKAEHELLRLIAQHSIKEIVCGLPLDEDGRITAQCEDCKNFCRRLEKRAAIRVHYFDEYSSSREAQSLRPKSKNGEDSIAAAIILQEYLDSNNSKKLVTPSEK